MTKKSFGCRRRGEAQRISYGGMWRLPRVQAVVSLVSPKSPVACPSTKGAPNNILTNLFVGLMQI
jgi:hypothetical protein